MSVPRSNVSIGLLAWLVCVGVMSTCSVATGIEPDFLMDSDPEIQVPAVVKRFDRDFKSIWLAALKRSEADMQRMAADTIVRAQEFGVPDLAESIPTLKTILTDPSSHSVARNAAARALIALDARDAADKLWQVAQEHGADIRQIVEPTLAEWGYAPATSTWLKRLESSETPRRELVLAVRGLARVQDQSALPLLLKLTKDSLRVADLRLEASAAAGQIADGGLEEDAQRLCQDQQPAKFVDRLCGIQLLQRHSSAAARQILTALASDAEPALAVEALKRLNEIDAALVLPMAATAFGNSDHGIRSQGITALLAAPTVERITLLGRGLNDPHPAIRRRISDALLKFSETAEYREVVLSSATEALAGERWQGQEQGALLMGALRHQPASARLVALLESARPEVMVASAWALRRVEVNGTRGAIVDKISRQTNLRLQRTIPGVDHQVAHLFEACGIMKILEAAPLVVHYVPKNIAMGERSRSAAIWAVGRAAEGVSNKKLSDALVDRVMDVDGKTPESALVKQMSLVTLVRIKAVDQAPTLSEFIGRRPPPTRLGMTMRWAMKELANEELLEPIPFVADQGHWFLEPLK